MKKPKWLARRVLLQVIAGCVVVAGLSLLAELWFSAFSEWFLWRLLLTCGLVATVAGLLLAVAGDLAEDTADRQDKYFN